MGYAVGMEDLSFTTFLKVSLTATTQGKLGLLHRMQNGAGGYDFYKRMKLAAREVARGETPPEEILAELSKIKREAERTHNVQMATRFIMWWQSMADAVALSSRPSGIYRTSEMAFGIRITPELSYSYNGNDIVTYLWATNLPKLTRQAAGAGLYMMRQNLGIGEFANAAFQIRDLRQSQTLTEEYVTNQSANILDADIALINSLWKSNSKS